jgi:hypothetical protein
VQTKEDGFNHILAGSLKDIIVYNHLPPPVDLFAKNFVSRNRTGVNRLFVKSQ